MSDNLPKSMEHNILGAMGTLKRILSLGMATYALLILTFLNASPIINKDASDMQIEMFGIKAYHHYYSLLFVLLYSVFAVLLFASIDLFTTTIESYKSSLRNDRESEMITLYPWLASPYHQRRCGPRIFWIFLLLAFANCVWLTYAHLVGINTPCTNVIETWVYRYLIGGAGLLACLVSGACLILIRSRIRTVRSLLHYSSGQGKR